MSDNTQQQPQCIHLVTTHGSLCIELFPSTCVRATEKFLALCGHKPPHLIQSLNQSLTIPRVNETNNEYTFSTNTIFHRLIRGMFIQAGSLEEDEDDHGNINIFSENEDAQNNAKFDSIGIVAFTPNVPQFIITLDTCEALSTVKYHIFGRISSDTLDTLREMGALATDGFDFPIDSPTISEIKVVYELNNNNNNNENNITSESSNNNDASSTQTTNIQINDTQHSTFNNDVQIADTQPIDFFTPPSSQNVLLTPPSKNTLGKRHDTEMSYSNGQGPSKGSTPVEFKRHKINETPDRNVFSPQLRHTHTPRSRLQRTETLLLDSHRPFMTPHLTSTLESRILRSHSSPHINFSHQVRPKWPTRIVIVRHGESQQNIALDLCAMLQEDIDTLSNVRDADIKLTEVGFWQSQQTGKYLSTTDRFDVCITSPYTRAIQTANAIIEQLPYQLKLRKDNWLREKEFGHLHGLSAEQVKKKFPQEYEIRRRDGPYWYRFPGGENYCDVELRLNGFLEKLARDYAGRSVLIVTHQVPYKLFRALIQHLDEEGVLALERVANCGIQEYLLDRLKAPEGRLKLKHFNYVCYKMEECPFANGKTKTLD
eukprot:TRINITY_DN4815_c0_g5_i1.p1 TRINITY_DN4815_c0_g5~~TRINITY_DN4815_c0_g5_i1.p1  ORF type:complete len:624 (+),score=120.85 TRINITY_DN4815_c0_g5_i1:80-1873(+)